MSNIHKSLFDLEKIDKKFDGVLAKKDKDKDKKIKKQISFAKLKQAINLGEKKIQSSSMQLDIGGEIKLDDEE